jgi:hypothetical protein
MADPVRVVLRAVTGDARSFMAPGELGYDSLSGELVLAGFGGAPAAARVAAPTAIAYVELPSAPTTTNIPPGRAAIVKHDGQVRLYVNDAGVLRSVLLS